MNIGREMTTIREVIDAIAQSQPEAVFLIDPATTASISFRQLQQQAVQFSSMLRQAGLESGDKIAFLMDNGLVTAQLFLGTMYGGFVAVPLNVRAGVVQLSYMLDHCDAKVVFVEDQYTVALHEALRDVRREIRVVAAGVDGALPAFAAAGGAPPALEPAADDVALLMYSSGSTGKPKAAIHTHSSVLAGGRNSVQSHQLSSADRSLLVLPLYHINAECVTLIPTLLSGGSVVVAHRFVVSKFWDWIDDLHITWSALVPTIVSELVDWDDPKKDQRQAAFKRIRFFRSSSAPLSPSLQRQFLDKFNLPLLQAMGSTEAGNVFSNPVPPGANKIGSPGLIWGFQARIVDRQGVEVPSGESGEVLIRGAALTKGYYKDPEATAAAIDSDGWLHTGDLARQDEDGYFFVVGRSKELIIKGGVNIAPRQIDEVLEAHPAVLEAAAVGVPDRYFGEDAVAFAVLRPGVAAGEKELLAFCETRLGHFKTPSRIHFMKELPKGPSGKVQRLRLLDPDILSTVARTTHPGSEAVTINGNEHGDKPASPISSIPASSIEDIIAAAWADVLAVRQVDRHANFFALGGHSLLAIQCLSKLREKLPIALSFSDFFENGTVFEQAELVRQRLRPAEDGDPSISWERMLLDQYMPPAPEEVIPRRDSSLPCPLSPAQQRLWFLEQLNPGVPVYNEAEAVRLTGELNVEALTEAFNVIISRHEALRSTIKIMDEVPHAIVHESWPLALKKIDLSLLPPAERQSEVDRLLIDEPAVLYDLQSRPGIRVTLLRLSAREHVLILMMHHIICDWSSQGIIWRELSALYSSLLRGKIPALPAIQVTHGDYAVWDERRIRTTGFDEDLAFWEETLRGAPALLELPADRARPPIASYRGHRFRWKLNRALTEALRNASRQEKTSLFTIFSAALNTLFYRYTGSEDILIGIPLADRDRQDLQSVIGFLLYVHVLRTKLSAGMTFRDLLGCVQKGVLDLYTHRAIPFDQIVRKLQPERSQSYSPLFQVMLNWRDRDQHLSFIGLDGLAIDSLMAESNTSKFDLLLFATDNGEEIWLELEYSTDLFDQDRIARMLGHYQAVLEAVAADPGERIAEIPLLTAGERRQIVVDWNNTAAEFPGHLCIHELFEEQVRKTPQAIAVVFEKDSLSYEELNRRANRLAYYLRGIGVGPDTNVALCLERGLEMIVGLLAVLKAGGAYVPLDPAYPADRLAFMLEDSAPVALLTQAHLHKLFSGLSDGLPVLDLDAVVPPWAGQPGANPDPASIGLTPRHLAYVIYTSGSTGKPKGVMVEHRGLCNRITWMQRAYGLDAEDAVLQKTPFSFDVSVWEFFWPIVVGARLVMARPEGHKDPAYLCQAIRHNKITTLHFVPSMLGAFLEQDGAAACSSLTDVICSGEALPGSLVQRFQRQLPHAALHNLYGPTEATVDVTAWTCPAGWSQDSIPIGRPIANTRIYILDPCGKPVPVGVSGELYIGGVGVARGYLNRPELTAERFLKDPFATDPNARMYRTGDLSRWLPDGNIEFLGRNDFQVKLRGFRIELGEIEARLAEYPGISQSVVIAGEDKHGDKRLVAYVVPTDPHVVPAVEDLRGALHGRLPDYMIPAAFAVIERMPLTPNGKIDRKALSMSKVTAISTKVPVEAPRDVIEAKLVQIWERVLDARPIGIRTNFFDVGGYSLMIVKLFAQINKAFDRSLPIATIFRSPTIEQLAMVIRGGAIRTPVPIRAIGSKRPLFIVHSYLTYDRFRKVLDQDRPLYGLHESEDDSVRVASLDDRVTEYMRQIREVQPEGPYSLIAWCAAGPLTIELARGLENSGSQVAMLGLIDSAHPQLVAELRRQRKQRSFSDRLKGMISFHARRQAQFARYGRVRYAWRAFRGRVVASCRDFLKRHWKLVFALCRRLGISSPHFMYNLSSVEVQTVSPFEGKITLFRPSQTDRSIADQSLGWRNVALRGVDVVWVPGDHESMFIEPNISEFGRLLERVLEAQGDSRDPDPKSPGRVDPDLVQTVGCSNVSSGV